MIVFFSTVIFLIGAYVPPDTWQIYCPFLSFTGVLLYKSFYGQIDEKLRAKIDVDSLLMTLIVIYTLVAARIGQLKALFFRFA